MLGELNVNKKSLSKSILYDSDWECGCLYDFFRTFIHRYSIIENLDSSIIGEKYLKSSLSNGILLDNIHDSVCVQI